MRTGGGVRRKHRIGLLTLLFTDMVGSTRLKQALGDTAGFDRIQEHHAMVREILAGFPEGEEIGTAGDSFFLVFAKPSGGEPPEPRIVPMRFRIHGRLSRGAVSNRP